MRALSFKQLHRDLSAAGIAPAVIRRTLEELQDHCADAEAAAIAAGASRRQARRQARLCLGSAERIVDEASARRELLDWRHRWPQSARCLDSLGYCLLLPAVPFAYCASHAASITRWGLSSSLALCITAALLLALQWVIVV